MLHTHIMMFYCRMLVLVSLMLSTLLLQAREKSGHALDNTPLNEPASLRLPTGFLPQLDCLLSDTLPSKSILGYTKERRPVELYYFPGKRAMQRILITGGVHGSELSSIALAETLVAMLGKYDSLQYQVVVVPSLFPDNAAQAKKQPSSIGAPENIGRYSHARAPDPNRQMPAIGMPFSAQRPLDARGRRIEPENQWLLQLIQQFQPHIILSLHACHHTPMAGVYADPRTDCNQLALGYDTDNTIARNLVRCIQQQGGHTPGNGPHYKAQTRYPLDPPVSEPGRLQVRNLKGSMLPNGRGEGISLGTWASTAVCDTLSGYGRDAISIFTLEFPGCKRPQDYDTADERKKMARELKAWARGIGVFASIAPEFPWVQQPASPAPENPPTDTLGIKAQVSQ